MHFETNFVFDTSAVVALLETCSLEKELSQLGKKYQLLITERVREEYRAGSRLKVGIGLIDEIFTTVTTVVKEELLPYFHFKSSSGEFTVIAYALDQPNTQCVVDEEFARSICRLFHLDVIGTVGIIRKMLAEGLLERKAMNVLRFKLKRGNFYLTDRLLDELR